MAAAHDQVVLRAKKAEVEEALQAAATAFDHHSLKLALGTPTSSAVLSLMLIHPTDKAYSLKMDVVYFQKLHDDIIATQQAIANGLSQIDELLLTYAIELADAINYKLDDYYQVTFHQLVVYGAAC